MVNNILDYARGAMGALELHETGVDLPDLLAACVTALAPKARGKGIAIALDAAPPVRLRADRRRLREMVLSILDNAIKFNRAGGRAAVGAALTPAALAIRVTDDGPGIPAALRDRIFDPFFQGDRALARQHDGIGLGLPIVLRFAELHGGTVEIASEEGHGTTVTILLPAERVQG
jgi:signal transduction histidine kinase